jgi:hypothetical protein
MSTDATSKEAPKEADAKCIEAQLQAKNACKLLDVQEYSNCMTKSINELPDDCLDILEGLHDIQQDQKLAERRRQEELELRECGYGKRGKVE